MQHTVRGGGYLAPTERQPCYFDSKVKELWEKLPQIALARSILRPRVARAPDVPGSSKPARFRSVFGAASILKPAEPGPLRMEARLDGVAPAACDRLGVCASAANLVRLKFLSADRLCPCRGVAALGDAGPVEGLSPLPVRGGAATARFGVEPSALVFRRCAGTPS